MLSPAWGTVKKFQSNVGFPMACPKSSAALNVSEYLSRVGYAATWSVDHGFINMVGARFNHGDRDVRILR